MAEIMTLDDIGLKHQTDKASNGHGYLPLYEEFFAPLRNAPIVLLEIGVEYGNSLRTWAEYFPRAKIVGADIKAECRRFADDRVAVEIVDQSNIEDLVQLGVKHGPFDIVVEDGSHMWEHQITSLRTLFPFVRHGGYYVVEDLQTNYGDMAAGYKGIASASCVEYLKRWTDLIVGDDRNPTNVVEDAFLRTYGRSASIILFRRHACLIRKNHPPRGGWGQIGGPLVAPRASSIPVPFLVHVGWVGDFWAEAGFVDSGSDERTIQGFALEDRENTFEYRVRSDAGVWSGWCRGRTFLGTRGVEDKFLNGISLRLSDNANERFSLRVIGRFAGSSAPVEVGNGQDCASPAAAPLCALQIELERR